MDALRTVLQEYTFYDEELEEAFNSLKHGKSPRFDDILSSIVNFCMSCVFHPLQYISNLSLQTRVFPTEIKIARVSPGF